MGRRSGMYAVALALSLAPATALADTATAEALFREGKALMAKGNYEQACPKLADSYRAERATGSLLALAICYEKAGKTASAWASYSEAAGRARSEGNANREKAARSKAAELEGKLSRLTIEVAEARASLPDFSVTRDGEPISTGGYNTALPVDPGEHVIEVKAAGYKTWTARVVVKPDGDRASIAVPALEAIPDNNKPVAVSTTPATRTEPAPAPRRTSLRTWSYVTGAAGLVGIGLGSYFGLRAIGKNDDSKADCEGNLCGPQGTTDRNDARSAGTISTIAFAAGGVLLATGVTLFVLDGKKPESGTISAGVQALPGQAGFFAQGRF